jgi:tetratricopeptide (TPR) repeat protein
MQDELNKMPPELKKIRELDEKFMKLLEESKYVEAIDVCLAIQSEMPNIPENEKTGEKKQFFDELEDDIRDRIVHCKLKLEDYDSAIENALNFLEIRETYGIHSKLGICYFKKGRYYKARDHFNKAKNLNPNFEDKIVDNYLKQTIEMIADIEN